MTTQTLTAIAPVTLSGFFHEIMRWLRDTHMQNSMYRIAPTRKM
jgi:hypothetical protein